MKIAKKITLNLYNFTGTKKNSLNYYKKNYDCKLNITHEMYISIVSQFLDSSENKQKLQDINK